MDDEKILGIWVSPDGTACAVQWPNEQIDSSGVDDDGWDEDSEEGVPHDWIQVYPMQGQVNSITGAVGNAIQAGNIGGGVRF